MTSDRIREIQEQTAYPHSRSVQRALLSVWNETEQELRKELFTEDDIRRIIELTRIFDFQSSFNEVAFKEIIRQVKTK